MPIWIEQQSPEELRRQKVEAFSGEYEEEDTEAAQNPAAKVGEQAVVIGKRTGGEAVAHELGHAALGHVGYPEDAQDAAKRELEAWLWAKRKRGRLSSNIVRHMAINLVEKYDLTGDEIVALIQDAYSELDEEPPSSDYIMGILEKEWGTQEDWPEKNI